MADPTREIKKRVFFSSRVQTVFRSLSSLLFVTGAILAQMRFSDFIDKKVYLFIYPSCFAAILIGGFWLGLLATLICSLSVWYFFLPTFMSFNETSIQDLLGLITFMITGIILSVVQYQTEKSKLAKDYAVLNLASALRNRDEFISIASHELKTPLTALKLKLDLLLRQIQKQNLSDSFDSMVKAALQQAQRLNELIDTLLDITKIQAGIMELNYEETTLLDSVQKVTLQASELLKTAKCDLKIDVSSTTKVFTDRVRLEQILTNLLTNAIKYAPASLIEIAATIRDSFLCISVEDHGPGIPEDTLKGIFNRFDRGQAPKNTKGLGLGLYIAQNLAIAQGGAIRAESEVGKGTVFRVMLPLQRLKKTDQVKV